MKKIIAIIAVFIMSISISTFAFANRPAVDQINKETKNTINIASLPQDIQSKFNTLNDLRQSSKKIYSRPKEGNAGVRERARKIKPAYSANTERGKSLRENVASAIKENGPDRSKSLKERVEQFKAQNEERKAIREKLAPNTEQAKETAALISSQQETMKEYCQQLKTAINSRDYTEAGKILDNMISLKAQINANLSKLLDIRNSIKAEITN